MTGLLNTSHTHTEMLRAQYDADPQRMQLLIEEVRNLRGKHLLGLKPMREVINDPGDLRKPHDLRRRDVPDRSGSTEGKPMMGTKGIESDAANSDDLIVPLVRERCDIRRSSGRDPGLEETRHPLRGFPQVRIIEITAER